MNLKEIAAGVPFADRDHILLPWDAKSLHTREELQRNAAFIKNALPRWIAQDKDARGLVNAGTQVIASALHSVDTHYGYHGSDSPGYQYLKNPLGEKSFPTFYHGGDGTRLALLGSIDYMDYINKIEGGTSAYAKAETYMGVLITAAFDDSIFGYGRGEDEKRSGELAANTLTHWPYPFEKSLIREIKQSIVDSTFDEKELTHAGGEGAISQASLIGDLWILGLAESTVHAIRLGVENLYKPDTAAHFGQILREKAVARRFVGTNLSEFLNFIDQDPVLVRTFGEFMIKNEEFVKGHQFPDSRVDNLLIGRRENAAFQRLLGEQVFAGKSTVTEANNAALAYAYSRGANSHPGTPVRETDRQHPPHTHIVGRHLHVPYPRIIE